MPEEAKSGIQLASQANLLARFNQLCKFGVNFVTSQELGGDWGLLPEDVGLANSLYLILNNLECDASRKKVGDSLVKGLQDGSSGWAAGVLLVALHQSNMARGKKTKLVRRLDALPNCVLVLKKLCIMSLVTQTVLMDPVDSKLVTRFCGKMLTVSLFPDGPGQVGVEEHVRHKTYGPWEAERKRCRTVMMERRGMEVADRFTV